MRSLAKIISRKTGGGFKKSVVSFLCLGFALFSVATQLSGCSGIVLWHPDGPIGRSELFVIIAATGLMLIVVIPVIIMVLLIPRKYRASNYRAVYQPKWSRSARIEALIWLVPGAIVVILAALIWIMTHRLDPYKPIAGSAAPITVQAVSLDWKWLFIYPDRHIATVNQLVFPAHTPLSIRLTSDTVMTSFFIPQLGSQIYAMAGMQTRLHLMADRQGTYRGQNQQFSGRGYAEMAFEARAVSRQEFEAWIQQVGQSKIRLDRQRFEQLARPSVADPVEYFSEVESGLFEAIVNQHTPQRDAVNQRVDGPKAGLRLQ